MLLEGKYEQGIALIGCQWCRGEEPLHCRHLQGLLSNLKRKVPLFLKKNHRVPAHKIVEMKLLYSEDVIVFMLKCMLRT